MPACGGCGRELPSAEFGFCPFCGAPMAGAPDEQRKTVTVLFADLVGSTELGSRLDPEVLRGVMQSYWATARAAIERHGGSVAKFIGDAAVGVFGVPTAREDDAARAVRAAWDLVSDVRALSAEVEKRTGAPIGVRVGVNTGAAVVDLSTADVGLMVGDVANVGARLEQAAPPGQVYVGSATRELARDAAEFDELEPLAVKGKDEPLRAFRLVSVHEQKDVKRHRRFSGSLVGRRRQLQQARFAYDTAVEERACALLSIIGDGGVGKTRLVDALLDEVRDEAVVLFGRALPYGEGMDYWPLAQALHARDEGGLPTWEQMTEGVHLGEAIAMGLATMTGTADTADAPQMAWAFRRYLELLAAERPVVLVLDDVQWADEAVIEIVEDIVELSRDAPILVICMARPALLEQRPHWGGGRLNSTTVVLTSLGRDDSAALLDELIGADAPAELKSRILTAADGNPLFLEEVTATLADRGVLRETGHSWELVGDVTDLEVPATVAALLTARLDHLPRDLRRTLDAASVIGQVFYPDAVAKLVDADIEDHLEQLVRADLVRPSTSDVVGLEAYSFTHLTVQSAAYEALSFAQRADYHLHVGRWLDEQGGDRSMTDLADHHLERAAHHRGELGTLDNDLAEEVGLRLLRAAQRAQLTTGDRAGLALVDAALPLVPQDSTTWAQLTFERSYLLVNQGRVEDSAAAARELFDRANTMGWADHRLRGQIGLAWCALNAESDFTELQAEVTELVRQCHELGDLEGAVMARLLLAAIDQDITGDSNRAIDTLQACLDDLRPEHDPLLWLDALTSLLMAYTPGPRPLPEQVAALERVRESMRTVGLIDFRRATVALDTYDTFALAQGGFVEQARERARSALVVANEVQDMRTQLTMSWFLAELDWYADDFESAAVHLRRLIDDVLLPTDYHGTIASWVAQLALVLDACGDVDGAAAALDHAWSLADFHDLHSGTICLMAGAHLGVLRGDAVQTADLLAQAHRRLDGTDHNALRLCLLGVESLAADRFGDQAAALALAHEALALAQWLEWVPAIEQAQRRIAALESALP